MRAFGERHPGVEQTLVVGNHQEVTARVLAHDDDVAISGRPPGDERLVAEPFLENEIVCIAAPEDPLAGGDPIAVAALATRAWLLREPGSGTRALNERFLSRHGLSPRTLVLGSNGAIKQAAHERLGVSLLSRAAVATELRTGWLAEIRLLDGPEPRSWFVVRSAVGPSRPAVAAFTAFVLSHDAWDT
jgi:DNA-binding transcriptional LysR family regulator